MIKMFLQYFAVNAVTVTTILLIGNFLWSLFLNDVKTSKAKTLFIKLSIGLSVFVTIIAILFSKGKTIIILGIPLMIYLLYIQNIISKRREFRFDYRKVRTEILCCLGVLTPFLLFEYYFIYNGSSFGVNVPYYDLRFYGDLSASLIENGQENLRLHMNGLFPEDFYGAQPYHYFELWFNGGISKIFGVSPVLNFLLVTSTFFRLLVFVGIYGLLDRKNKKIIESILIVFILLGVSGVDFWFYESIELTMYKSGLVENSVMTFYRKLLPVYWLGIGSLFLFRERKYESALIVLLFLGVIYIGTTPAMFGFVFLGALYLGVRENKWRFLLFYLFVVVSFVVFYVLFSNKANESQEITYLIGEGLSGDVIKQLLFKFIFPQIRIIIFYIPYLLIALLFYLTYKKKLNKEIYYLIIFGVLICLIGGVASSLLTGNHNASQLLMNNMPLINCIVIYLIASMLKDKSYLLLFSIGLISLYNLSFTFSKYESHQGNRLLHSDEFKEACIEELNSKPKSSVVGIFSGEYVYKSGAENSRYLRKTGFLDLSKRGVDLVELNPFQFRNYYYEQDLLNQSFAENLELIKYSESLPEKESEDKVRIQLDFIQEYKVEFIYVEEGCQLDSDVLKELNMAKKYCDQVSGDCFFVLDN